MSVLSRLDVSRWAAFVLGGGLNTALTYLIYLAMQLAMPYQAAYFLAFATGVAFAYLFNARYVFSSALSWKRALVYPAIYGVQYIVSALALGILVEYVGVYRTLAPLLVTAMMLPATYLMNRWVLTAQGAGPERANAVLRHPVIAVAAATAMTIAAIWLPFGFRLGGLIEEWDVLGLFVTHGLFFVANGSSPLPMHAIRPLTILPHALAYLLSPTSFAAWHMLLIAGLLAKGTAAGMLIWQATRSRAAAIATATLLLVYPADTMQLSFRGIHIAWSMAAMLMASAALVTALGMTSGRKRLLAAIFSCILALASMCMYEAAIVFMPLPFAILLVRQDLSFRGWPTRSSIAIALSWCAMAGLYVGFALWILKSGESYQADVALGGGAFATVRGNLPRLFSMAMPRIFLGGWLDAGSMLRDSFTTHVWLAISVLAVVVTAGSLARVQGLSAPQRAASKHRWIGLLCIGIIFAALGYAPYLVSGSHMLVSQRTFLFASFGGVACWVAILGSLHGRLPVVAKIGYVALLALGLASQWVQFHHYVSLSDLQRRELSAIASGFDGNASGRTVVVADSSDYVGQDWMFPRKTLPLVLAYLYGHAVGEVEVCHMGTGEWFRSDDGGRHGSCGKDASGWFFRSPPALPNVAHQDAGFHLDEMSAVEVAIPANAPEAIPNPALMDPTVRARLGRMLSIATPGPLDRMFIDTADPQAYHWTFGRWWSLDQPVRGTGWRGPEWDIRLRKSRAYAWKTAPLATLEFGLQPTLGAYVLSGRAGQFARDLRPSMISIRVNGQSIPLSWNGGDKFRGPVPSGLLRAGMNRLVFEAPVNADYYGLSFQLSAVDLRPTD